MFSIKLYSNHHSNFYYWMQPSYGMKNYALIKEGVWPRRILKTPCKICIIRHVWKPDIKIVLSFIQTISQLVEIKHAYYNHAYMNSPRSIYWDSNKTPTLSGHFSRFDLVFLVLKCLMGIARQWIMKNLQLWPLSLEVVLEF